MKKIIYSLVVLFMCSHSVSAQNNMKRIFVIPAKPQLSAIAKVPTETTKKLAKQLTDYIFVDDNPNSFLSSLPVISLKNLPGRMSFSFFTELSLNDMLENTVNSINGNLLNTYDGHITELFKDAPSLVQVKCVIPF